MNMGINNIKVLFSGSLTRDSNSVLLLVELHVSLSYQLRIEGGDSLLHSFLATAGATVKSWIDLPWCQQPKR